LWILDPDFESGSWSTDSMESGFYPDLDLDPQPWYINIYW